MEAYGIRKSSPSWRRCVRGTDESLDMGVSMLFINGSGFTNESMVHVSITERFWFLPWNELHRIAKLPDNLLMYG